MTTNLERLRRCSVAFDLGAARTRVHLRDTGLIVDEPTVAAVNLRSGGLIAVGTLAEGMTGRTPDHVRVVRPVAAGTVVDIAIAQRMLRLLVGGKVRRAWRRRPLLSAAVCVPHDAEPLACRAAVETLEGLGMRRVELVDNLIAASIGCGLPVDRAEAAMIVLCGTAVTQVAVLSLGSVVAADRVPVGGEALDRAFTQHLRDQYRLSLPDRAVRPLYLILRSGGAAVHGRDAATGRVRSVRVDAAGVWAALEPPLRCVLDTIGAVLRRCPPDLVADLGDQGLVLAGGSATLPGLDMMLCRATGMPVRVAQRPDLSAVRGLGAMVDGQVRPLLRDPLSV
ncbi:rod shape-determining protein [Streptomyces sp. B1866]|uniref:rod shape-determining protein n=1 Tax=Streptomyces sp. B1866 TaxID=3075431 RepID=UPI00289113AE|nr:rod shape-determining protein [Streptomyces sp. B1866]MDT3396507.1 rod shape-determining protein [Streptomyces sp. B1866]